MDPETHSTKFTFIVHNTQILASYQYGCVENWKSVQIWF